MTEAAIGRIKCGQEDDVCISSKRDCENVTPNIRKDLEVQLPTTIQNDAAYRSKITDPENLLLERDWAPSSDESNVSEDSVRNQRKPPKRTRTIPVANSNGSKRRMMQPKDELASTKKRQKCEKEPQKYIKCKQCDGKFKSYYFLSKHKPCSR